MTYDEWAASVPDTIREDTVWRIEAYRLGLFLSELAWSDVDKLFKHRKTIDIADQLLRSTRRIASTICEGYTRDSGRARATYYEYAAGSARESRDWYYRGRAILKEKVTEHRMMLCQSIIKLTLRMASNERRMNRRPSGE